MQSEQRRKRKRFHSLKPPFSIPPSFYYWFRCSALFLFLCFFFFFNGFPFSSDCLIRPILTAFQPIAHSLSIKDLGSEFYPLTVEDSVLFPDHVLLLLSKRSRPSWLNLHGGLDCVYREELSNSSAWIGGYGHRNRVVLPVISVDEYNELQSIARCPLPPSNYSAAVELRKRGALQMDKDNLVVIDQPVHSWELLAYAAALDGETAVVFVKGLNLRPDRVADPNQFRCHFNQGNSKDGDNYSLTTKAVTAAQEIVRCSLPLCLQKDPAKARGIRVSVSINAHPALTRSRGRAPIPSVAKIMSSNFEDHQSKNQYELCVCTMLWNQAPSLPEWIVYHAWLGVLC